MLIRLVHKIFVNVGNDPVHLAHSFKSVLVCMKILINSELQIICVPQKLKCHVHTQW